MLSVSSTATTIRILSLLGVRQLVRSKIYRFIFMAFFIQVKKRCQEANEHSDGEERILTFSCQTKISQKSV